MEIDRPCMNGFEFFNIHSGKQLPAGKSKKFDSTWFRALLGKVTDLLLSETGRERVRGIYLCGSFATGEGSVIVKDEKALFVSDLDLVIVVDSEKLHGWIRREKQRLQKLLEDISSEAVFRDGISVGVYHISEMKSMPPSPLNYDLIHCAVKLFGNAVLPAEIDGGKVSVLEAARLLENRACSFLGSIEKMGKRDAESRISLAYSIAKAYTDILASALIMEGKYTPGYQKRVEQMKRAVEDGWEVLAEELFRKIEKWTEYKLSPYEIDDRVELDQEWKSAAGDLLYQWRAVRSRLSGYGSEVLDVEQLAGIFNSGYSLKQRFRRWKKYLQKLPAGAGARKIFLHGRNILKFAPAELITLNGIAVLLQLESGNEGAEFIPFRNGFGLGGKDLRAAAGRIYEIWTEFNK